MIPSSAYLDYAATTPMRPEAVAAMTPFLSGTFGNPSGGHAIARAAKTALEEAREAVAGALGASPGEVVFTAGGSEADNLAVKGAARAARAAGLGDGVVTVAFEHKAVLASCDRLEREGFRVARVAADRDGIVDLGALADALDDRTVVVSVMLVNNEVGTIQPLDEIAELLRAGSPSGLAHRCRAGGALATGRPRDAAGAVGVDLGAQVRWPERHRRARRARRRPDRAADGRRRAGAGASLRHLRRRRRGGDGGRARGHGCVA